MSVHMNYYKYSEISMKFLIEQAISTASGKKYGIGIQADPLEFTIFFLNALHTGLGGGKRPGSSIKVFFYISNAFLRYYT